MTDPNFMDLKLMSQGPYAQMEMDPRVPDLQSVSINASSVINTYPNENPFEMDRSPLPSSPEPTGDAPTLSPVLIDPNTVGTNTARPSTTGNSNGNMD